MSNLEGKRRDAFIAKLIQRAGEDGRLVAGWLPDDPGVRTWLREQLGMKDSEREQDWQRLLLSAVPQGAIAADGWREIAARSGLNDDEQANFTGLLWKTRSLGALKITRMASPRAETVSLAAPEKAKWRKFRSHGLNRSEADLVFSMRQEMASLEARRLRRAPTAARSLEDDEQSLLLDLIRAGLPADRSGSIPGTQRSLETGHVGDWPMALFVCSRPPDEAEKDFMAATGLPWEGDWPSGSEQGVLLTTRDFGISYVRSKLSEDERQWVTAQLMAAYVYHRIRRREMMALTSLAHRSDLLQDPIQAVGPLDPKAPFDVALFDKWPHISLALRLIAPPTALRGLSIDPQSRDQAAAGILSRDLRIPLRVAAQRLRQF